MAKWDLNLATLVLLSFPDTWLRGWIGHAPLLCSATFSSAGI